MQAEFRQEVNELPTLSRILGIDYGEKRIGLALSDPLRITAQGIDTLERRVSIPCESPRRELTPWNAGDGRKTSAPSGKS